MAEISISNTDNIVSYGIWCTPVVLRFTFSYFYFDSTTSQSDPSIFTPLGYNDLNILVTSYFADINDNSIFLKKKKKNSVLL